MLDLWWLFFSSENSLLCVWYEDMILHTENSFLSLLFIVSEKGWIRRIGNYLNAFSYEDLALIRRISFPVYGVLVRRKSFLQASQDLRELSALVADKGAESDSKDQKIKELEVENLRLKDELATKERFHTELQKEQAREIEFLKKAYEDMVMKLELALQVEQDMMKDIKTLKADIDEEIRVLKKQKVGSLTVIRILERLQLRRNNWDSDTFEFDEVLTEFASHKKTNAKTSHYFLECKNSCWILEYVLHQDIHFGTPEKEE
ncbi:hypothetical protein Tco_0397247 [Tanacetum coccineum]